MRKTLIITLFISAVSTSNCSYISDSVEGAITNRSSFSIDAVHEYPNIIITWVAPRVSKNFAGIEIYITKEANNEFSGYKLLASKHLNNNLLEDSVTTSFTFDASTLNLLGVYYFKVGYINWDHDETLRTTENKYVPAYPGNWDSIANYNTLTHLADISGFSEIFF